MGKYSLLEKIIDSNHTANISSINFTFNLLISLILSLLVAYIYARYGKTISNRGQFASVFPLLSMVTMFIIYVVKSSLALSLGLVGALSIVRFRSAIKEPEELVFIFLSISIGLGLGANQIFLTIITTLFICLFIYIRSKRKSFNQKKCLSLLITFPKVEKYEFDKIIYTINQYSNSVNQSRYFEDSNILETVFLLDIESFTKLRQMQKELVLKFPKITIDFVDDSDF